MKRPIYHFLLPNQFTLTSTFLRFQETYESPKFRNKGFSLEEFQDWYASTRPNGNFTYYQDWVGFNFPSSVIEGFTPERFGLFSRKEHWLLNHLSPIEGDFYVIASTKSSKKKSAKSHELVHALFYLDKDYSDRVMKIIEKYDFTNFKIGLSELGYCEEVFVDEINAYICTGIASDLLDLDEKSVESCKPELVSLFHEFFNIDVLDQSAMEVFFEQSVHQIDGVDLLYKES